MVEESFKRKLTTMFSADVEGYSRLMAEDEASTVKTLKAYREIMTELIKQHRGRVVDSPGDNVLAEFTSVVDAVQCAVAFQKELQARNAELSENRRMAFRIGINLGDVIEDAERIYGDGVNIAARIEGLAEAGGVCISGTAYDQVKNKLALGYEYLGEHTVKNISEPVRVYRALMEPEAAGKVIGEKRFGPRRWQWMTMSAGAAVVVAAAVVWYFVFRPSYPPVEPASVERMAYPLPDKPSIAVLPFENMSAEPEQEYFSDALTEEIITALARVPKLFVIARNSTFTYKGKPVKIQKVAEDLGVQYVVEGSVQRSGDRVRITAQLIDAIDGKHLWAEKYDRVLRNIFVLQDEITMKIITALQVKLTEGEIANVYAKRTTNLEAYLKAWEGKKYYDKYTKEDNARARQLYEEALALDPEYSGMYAAIGWTHFMDARFGWSKSRRESMEKALELAQKALAMDEIHIAGGYLMAYIYRQQKQYEKSIAEVKRLIDLTPNLAAGYKMLAGMLYPLGRGEEVIAAAKKVIRLDPMTSGTTFYYLGMGHWVMGQYEEAIAAYEKALHLRPTSVPYHIVLTATYSLLDREEEARAAAAELLKLDPEFSVDHIAKALPFKDKAYTERYVNALRKAGLK